MGPGRVSRLCALLLALGGGEAAAEAVPITLLQINDVYEIEPVQGGSEGGLARLATVRRELARENPRTFMILAGDAFSPSALGTARVGGQPIAGAQMVAALNAAGLDYATFGNHEFDIPEEQFRRRLEESRATWFSGNVRDGAGAPFPGVPESVVVTVRGERGARVRLGLIGVTLDSGRHPWVSYLDALETARRQAKALRPKVDVLIGVTHLSIAQDQQLAETAPELDLILGGHEHENCQILRGPRFIPILKADANARTVYVHRLSYDTRTRRLAIRSTLRRVTRDIKEDRATARVVREWTERGFRAFRAGGFEPTQTVALTPVTLDGKEASVRNRATPLTDLIAEAMLREWPAAEAAVFNAGSIRIDDEVPPGPITQYDVLRILPFGGKVLGAEMKGALLARFLEAGRANRGSGGFLLAANVEAEPQAGAWRIGGQLLEPDRIYRIAIADFLLSGGEQSMGFLTRSAPGLEKVTELRDVRFALMDEMRRRWPAAEPAAPR